MTLPTTFNTVSSPATGAELDGNFAAVGALGTVQCVATGSNTIVLTPVPGYPAVTAYGLPYPVRFGFTAAGGSTLSVTVQVGSLAALPLYTSNGTSQAGNGSLLSGIYYEIAYVSTYNTGTGGFVLVAPLPSAATPAALGATRNLKVTNGGTPSTTIAITAAQALLVTSTGGPFFTTPVSVTIDLTTNGPNGMDTLPRPTSNWVYCYLISNGSLVAGLATATSPLSGSPTLPSGYIYSSYVGAMFCDGSQNLLRSKQVGNSAQYTVTAATNTALLPNIANGVAGTYSSGSPTFVSVTITPGFVPATASSINIVADSNWESNTGAAVQFAPNNAYQGFGNSSGNIPPFNIEGPIGAFTTQIELEGSAIFWASNASGGAISCFGWVDSWSR